MRQDDSLCSTCDLGCVSIRARYYANVLRMLAVTFFSYLFVSLSIQLLCNLHLLDLFLKEGGKYYESLRVVQYSLMANKK